MKQGTNNILAVDIGVKLDTVSSIEFKFEQGTVTKSWTYPSTSAVRVTGTNTINLTWTIEDTFAFVPNKPVYMDSFVTLSESGLNPETEIITIILDKTLFTQSELVDDDE